MGGPGGEGEWLVAAFAAAAGLALGSFLNVVIYRLPRQLSIWGPRSFCPRCRTPIVWYRNVPVLSYLLLRGRCGTCGVRISPRYPLVELSMGTLALAAVARYGPSWSAAIAVAFAAAMLSLALIDLECRLLPDAITLPGAAVGLATSFLNPRVGPGDALVGLLLGGGLLYGVGRAYRRVRRREGMGMGDVKLMAMVGAFLGWRGALMTVLLGSLAGSVVGVALVAARRRDWDYALPFGTFLAATAVAVDWWGVELLSWYASVTGLAR